MLDEDDAELEGVILCPLFPPTQSYAVRFLLDVNKSFTVDPNFIVYDPLPSSSGGDGGEMTDTSPRKEKEVIRDSPPTVEEREWDPACTHVLIDTSSSTSNNIIEVTNPQEHSQNARVQRRSLTVASADFHSSSSEPSSPLHPSPSLVQRQPAMEAAATIIDLWRASARKRKARFTNIGKEYYLSKEGM